MLQKEKIVGQKLEGEQKQTCTENKIYKSLSQTIEEFDVEVSSSTTWDEP